MGFVDDLLGNVLGMARSSESQGTSSLLVAALQLLQQNGGLEGVLARLRQRGLGAPADSWVSTGHNLPADVDAISRALGSGPLADIAQRLGLSHQEVAGGLADVLPGLVDSMGRRAAACRQVNDVISRAIANLQRRTP